MVLKGEYIMPKKFDKLEKKIEHEYEKKGYGKNGKKRAKNIGYATASKIARKKSRKKK